MYIYIIVCMFQDQFLHTQKNIIPQTSIDPENRSSQDFKRNVI